MSGDQLDLDGIEARAEDFPRYGLTGGDRQLIDEDVPALVAEVRLCREDHPHSAELIMRLMRAEAEVRRLREQVRDLRPSMTLCNDADNHEQPCNCGSRRRIPLPRPAGCCRHSTDARPGDCPDCREIFEVGEDAEHWKVTPIPDGEDFMQTAERLRAEGRLVMILGPKRITADRLAELIPDPFREGSS